MDLTPIQAAYWTGRDWSGPSGGVSAHLYTEFQTSGLDPARLVHATQLLFGQHPMLRLRVTASGQQVIQPLDERHGLRLDDLTACTQAEARERLLATRHRMTHQRLDLAAGEAAEFTLSSLPDGQQRLHVDLDMVAADPSCFALLMDDLARFYEDPMGRDQVVRPEACFFEYLDRRAARALPDVGQAGWLDQFRDLPPAPAIPLGREPATPESIRLSAILPPASAVALRDLARQSRSTQTALYLGVFAAVLGHATGESAFRLTLPAFFRSPVMGGVGRLVGDFTEILPIGLYPDQSAALADLIPETAREIARALSREPYAGIAALRELSRHRGDLATSPVVFTSGLDLDGEQHGLLGPRVRKIFGQMIWTISQAPQVALDIQVARLDDGVLLNWDVRKDLLPLDWVESLFDAFHRALGMLADDPELIGHPLRDWLPTVMQVRPLNDLQRAYLLGRGGDVPLGNVAMQEYRRYHGRIDLDALIARAGQVMARHPALRMMLDPRHSALRVLDEVPAPVEVIDLSALALPEAEARLHELGKDFARAPMPLDGLLWRMLVVRLPQGLAPDPDVLLAKIDALILDGAGIAQVMAELLAPELSLAKELPQDAPQPRDQAADAAWWKDYLARVEGPPDLPWLRPLESIDRPIWSSKSRVIARAELAHLTRLGAMAKLTRNSVAMATVLEVVSRWTPDLALCVAVPVAAAAQGALRNGSSFVAVDYRADQGGFLDHARRFQADLLDGMTRPGLSGIGLTRMLMGQNGGKIALPVVITNGLGWARSAEDADAHLVEGLVQTPQVALDLRLSLGADGALCLRADYVEQALSPEVVDAMLDAVTAAFAQLARQDQLALSGADFLPPQPASEPVPEHGGQGHLARIAAHLFGDTGARTALVHDGERISYHELGRRVLCTIAGLAARGVANGDVVAICLPRGPEHLALTLACAFSGIIWVPVDAASPPERLDYLLANSAPRLVVSHGDIAGWPHATPQALAAHDPSAPPADPEALSRSDRAAYYLYTSGTTGRPKCVVLSNRATANVVNHTLDAWRITGRDVVMSVTPLHHDMSMFDLLGTLAAGATLLMPRPDEEKDAVAWNRLVSDHGVTVWCSVPAMVEMLLACAPAKGLAALRLVAQGGDYIKPAVIERLRQLCPDAALWSLGGPTETTIWSIWHPITPDDRRIIPYGRAIGGNRYLVLNPRNEPSPAGVAGRIHTTGVNLALGYLRDGVLEQTDFLEIEGMRAFRSGDLGRLRDDGTILFDSRVNGYVKVRGVRISLTDVEAELAAHPAVAQALVVDIRDHRDETILAALVTGPELPKGAALRAFLGTRLPQSHLPDRIITVEALPLSANGKVDRRRARALAETAQGAAQATARGAAESDAQAGAQPAEPEDRVTRLILAAFREALGSPGIGADDDFFDHGGHSLVATRIIGKLLADHGIALRFGDLFRHPTARALASVAGTAEAPAPEAAGAVVPEEYAQTMALPEAATAPLSLAQHSLWKAYAAFGYGPIFNLPFALRFPVPVDERIFGQAFADLIRRHPVLRSHFHDNEGSPLQQVVPVADMDRYKWFWTSDEAGDASRETEAHHGFDLATQLPLRIRFFREKGEQVLSLLFHHVVIDEWSLNLLIDQLRHAYRHRQAGLPPDWPDQPPGFHRFAAEQIAASSHHAHLDYWLDHLRGMKPARPILGGVPDDTVDGAGDGAKGGGSAEGGWIRIDLPQPVARGLYATARRNAASLFATVYAGIGAALGRLGGIGDLVIGTSAAGRNDARWFDTVGYFTTMTAHRLALSSRDTPAALIAQVRDRIAGSLPHSEIPLDLVGEALTGAPVTKLDEIFEVFIQIHAQNRMNGAIELMDGQRLDYRQIDPDKVESLLGLQFEIVEDVADETSGLRIMMSYRSDRYSPPQIDRITHAVAAMLARFAGGADDQPLDGIVPEPPASPRWSASV